MHPVTIEAATQARVLRLSLLVTIDAGARLQRRRSVRAVAIPTGLIGVRADGGMFALRLLVTAHAARGLDREVGAKSVAVAALRSRGTVDRIGDVQGRLHVRVAPIAQLVGRCRERVAVTVGARHLVLADVDRVTRALAHLVPRRGYVLQLAPALASARDHEQDRPARERGPHRAPIG